MKECVERRYLAAYCAVLDNDEIVAAFTLMNDALMISSEEEKIDFFEDLRFGADSDIIDFFKKQSSYPAINIGHLGTSLIYQSKGIGMAIIDLVADTFLQYRQAGCQFITVDALNNKRTTKFYSDNDLISRPTKIFVLRQDACIVCCKLVSIKKERVPNQNTLHRTTVLSCS